MILFLKSYLISILLIIAFVNFSIQHVVPSSKNPGDAARDYCKTFGWKPAAESQHSNIKGVRNAEVGQFPMIAALYAVSTVDGLKESRYFCSGSLISDKFVVTGATCVTRKRYIDSYFVRLGRVSSQFTMTLRLWEFPNDIDFISYHLIFSLLTRLRLTSQMITTQV